MIQQCHAAGVFGVLVFFSSKCTREILLCRKPEVILDLVFALQDCGAYFVSFSLSLFFFSPSARRTSYEYERSEIRCQ